MGKKVYKDRNGNVVVPKKVAPGVAFGARVWGNEVRTKGLEEAWKIADQYVVAGWSKKHGVVVFEKVRLA